MLGKLRTIESIFFKMDDNSRMWTCRYMWMVYVTREKNRKYTRVLTWLIVGAAGTGGGRIVGGRRAEKGNTKVGLHFSKA